MKVAKDGNSMMTMLCNGADVTTESSLTNHNILSELEFRTTKIPNKFSALAELQTRRCGKT